MLYHALCSTIALQPQPFPTQTSRTRLPLSHPDFIRFDPWFLSGLSEFNHPALLCHARPQVTTERAPPSQSRLPSFPHFSANSATPREKSPSTLRNARPQVTTERAPPLPSKLPALPLPREPRCPASYPSNPFHLTPSHLRVLAPSRLIFRRRFATRVPRARQSVPLQRDPSFLFSANSATSR